MTMPDVSQIIAYENGDLNDADTLDLFSGLVKSGLAWSLQGSYGRMATSLIDGGWLTPEGEVTDHARDLLAGSPLLD